MQYRTCKHLLGTHRGYKVQTRDISSLYIWVDQTQSTGHGMCTEHFGTEQQAKDDIEETKACVLEIKEAYEWLKEK